MHLDTFRGESRFTTWVYAVAVNAALVAARRERWKRVPLDQVLDLTEVGPWSLTGHGQASIGPDHRLVQEELLATLREGIDHTLTERQRQALRAVVFEGIPLDEVARLWNSNRNAVYKLLHDARRKLKAYLEQRGFRASDIDALSTTAGKMS
jgi:RNA polymerase sigma-70 factor (ECF subfamily)